MFFCPGYVTGRRTAVSFPYGDRNGAGVNPLPVRPGQWLLVLGSWQLRLRAGYRGIRLSLRLHFVDFREGTACEHGKAGRHQQASQRVFFMRRKIRIS